MLDDTSATSSLPPAAPPLSTDPGASAPTFWRGRDLVLFVIFLVVAEISANLLVLIGYMALRPLVGWQVSPEALGENAFFLLAFQSVFHGLVLGYVYLLIVVNYRQRFWAALAWRALAARQAGWFSVGGVALAAFVRFAPTLLPDKDTFPLQRLFASPQAGYALAGFAVLVAPFMEELIFRGVLFPMVERLAGLRVAIVSTAALFGAIHIPEYWGAWNHVLLIFLVGLVFSLARGLTRSLAPSIVMHISYNASMIVALFIETDRFAALQAGLV